CTCPFLLPSLCPLLPLGLGVRLCPRGDGSEGRGHGHVAPGCHHDMPCVSVGLKRHSLGSTLLMCSDFCRLNKDVGPCMGMNVRFFYNASSMACETFHYGGCLGNGNNFPSEKECLQTCRTEGKGGSPSKSEQPLASAGGAGSDFAVPLIWAPTAFCSSCVVLASCFKALSLCT
uniref:BPTI/Kunitz inhibitor domain-containing protein n=1 Tax=Chelonoidis abingdonii TaxID=106734 RepID=A0A8C0HAP4_CHEAB